MLAATQSVGVGILTPDTSATLDVTAANKGLLVLRFSLNSLNDNVTIPSTAPTPLNIITPTLSPAPSP